MKCMERQLKATSSNERFQKGGDITQAILHKWVFRHIASETQ